MMVWQGRLCKQENMQKHRPQSLGLQTNISLLLQVVRMLRLG
jgi:hypothetical protein